MQVMEVEGKGAVLVVVVTAVRVWLNCQAITVGLGKMEGLVG